MQVEQGARVALVTGASRGIGQAILLQLARAQCVVIGTATTEQGAAAISTLLHEQGLSGMGKVLDVRQRESVDSLLEEVTQQVGAPTILINNAGITRDNLFLRMKTEEWDDVIATNLSAVYYLTKACVRPMLKARWGRIISVGSVVGATGNPGQANYAAAKAALGGLSRSLAAEVAERNITVNIVAPGFIDTDMTRELSEQQRANIMSAIPMQRLGQAQEVAHLVGFLASAEAAYVTGQTIHVNGGMFMG